jgi:hypothetical protein
MLKTLEKEAAREFVRQKITGRLETLIDAQIDNAVGSRHLMMRDPDTGRFERVTGSPEQIDEALNSDNAFWIYTKDPSVQAFRPRQVQFADADGGSLVIRWQRVTLISKLYSSAL